MKSWVICWLVGLLLKSSICPFGCPCWATAASMFSVSSVISAVLRFSIASCILSEMVISIPLAGPMLGVNVFGIYLCL